MNDPASPTAVSPIARAPLHEEVARRIRDLIVEGELAPGTRVPERELCARFGISRTPLREALKILASEGLVDLQHHKGAVIAQLTPALVDEMFEVMEALEALAGELACARASDAALAEIAALHQQMLVRYAKRELSEYFQLNQRIHEAIVAAAGNTLLSQLYRGLSARIRRARYMANLSPARWRQAVAEHEQILAALTARDGARAARLLKEHLQHKADVVKAVLLGHG